MKLPGLKPIENLQAVSKRKLTDIQPSNVDDLTAAIKLDWTFFTVLKGLRLMASMLEDPTLP